MTALKKQHKEELKSKYINRELSWLKFNDRVLLEAQNIENPLYERVKFLSIAGSNNHAVADVLPATSIEKKTARKILFKYFLV